MQRVFSGALAIAVLLTLQPARAQPAKPVSQPAPAAIAAAPTAAPTQLVPAAQPPNPVTEAAAPVAAPAATATPQPGWTPPLPPTVPEDVIGICQCLYSHQSRPAPPPPNNQRLGLRCLSGVDRCKSSCGNSPAFAFVPHAEYTCPGHPEEPAARVASTS